ncbi:hypothetical protein GXW78_02585 [Roseomonas terrae]|jgi:hypothetical protein|uniref:Uncharacterized protein n=1 Tax=Neoroseomonas terrae TaxID=424799 RepID=A0ABS5EBZ6_9PROT|nr:hypothetical protein [Neoroseomonas terrae]MBR0648536.1 hypothetical protein [Neoroseomonas terrae]
MTGWRVALLGIAAAACAEAPSLNDGDIHIRYVATGRMQEDVTLRHAGDATHHCALPRRARLPSAGRPAPVPDQPPSHVFGYGVVFGPDFPADSQGLSAEWRGYGPQARFSLDVFPAPGTLEADGPVRLGRAFRITVGNAQGLWERSVAEGAATDAVVTIAPDGRSGRFRVAGLVRQVPHNRLPESEAITVTGSWHCP